MFFWKSNKFDSKEAIEQATMNEIYIWLKKVKIPGISMPVSPYLKYSIY